MSRESKLASFVGLVAVMRGDIRQYAIASADWLLASGVRDQGITSLFSSSWDCAESFAVLRQLARLRLGGERFVREIDEFEAEYSDDLCLATSVAIGSWNCLAGVWHLREGASLKDGTLAPSYRSFDSDEQEELLVRLTRARETARNLCASIHLCLRPERGDEKEH